MTRAEKSINRRIAGLNRLIKEWHGKLNEPRIIIMLLEARLDELQRLRKSLFGGSK